MRQWLGKAFTLVELVIVIAIIGILAAIAIPRFIDIRNEAYIAQRDGIIASVRAGILTVASKNQVAGTPGTFPPNLEEVWNTIGTVGGLKHAIVTACDVNPCFETVMEGGYSDKLWTEQNGVNYIFTPTVGTGLRTYTYTPGTGIIQ